ncbi:MAG: LysM peptidoglycan-binding domain-containing protein [Christensenellales bacterium]
MKKMLKKVVIIVLALSVLTIQTVFADSTYTVKPGDTLYKIAKTNGVTVNELLTANPVIKNPSVIFAGQKITIPSTKLLRYTVQRGDTMWGIANKYQISLAELQKANSNITDFSKIYVGQTVIIPDAKSLQSHEQQVFEIVNKERLNRGLPLLKLNAELSRVARFKSQDMIDKGYFAHQSPTYGSPFQMMQKFGLRFSAAGENIAYGQRTAEEVMRTWMNSAGHKANILSQAYTNIGIGVAKAANGTLYWTQMFMNPY